MNQKARIVGDVMNGIILFHILHFVQRYLPACHSVRPDQRRGSQDHRRTGSRQAGRQGLREDKGLSSFALDHRSRFIYVMLVL